MNKRKKIILFFLILILIFCTSSCSSSNKTQEYEIRDGSRYEDIEDTIGEKPKIITKNGKEMYYWFNDMDEYETDTGIYQLYEYYLSLDESFEQLNYSFYDKETGDETEYGCSINNGVKSGDCGELTLIFMQDKKEKLKLINNILGQ